MKSSTFDRGLNKSLSNMIRDRSLFMAGVAQKRNVFLGKTFATQPHVNRPYQLFSFTQWLRFHVNLF
jgi:hypothetical protein